MTKAQKIADLSIRLISHAAIIFLTYLTIDIFILEMSFGRFILMIIIYHLFSKFHIFILDKAEIERESSNLNNNSHVEESERELPRSS